MALRDVASDNGCKPLGGPDCGQCRNDAICWWHTHCWHSLWVLSVSVLMFMSHWLWMLRSVLDRISTKVDGMGHKVLELHLSCNLQGQLSCETHLLDPHEKFYDLARRCTSITQKTDEASQDKELVLRRQARLHYIPHLNALNADMPALRCKDV